MLLRNQNQGMNSQNLLNSFGGRDGLLSKAKELESELRKQGKDPNVYLQELINQGKIPQNIINLGKTLTQMVGLK